ncbi:MAG: type I DNA topoisomerase, partial [Clostridia bacterium]|nr:type I DNA topoisomerase [Clostridia bacterium]
GHVRDLPKSKLGIDVEHGFAPQYINIRGKGDLIRELRKDAQAADQVLLAPDPDREGEAISWHLLQVLGADPGKVRRITFNEITKNTVREAIRHPREIDMSIVDAQQTRRILDRLVGSKLSPFLWKSVKNGLSAGRVQSVATRIIVEREEAIHAFVPEEYWLLTAVLLSGKGEELTARYYGTPAGKKDLHTEADVKKVLSSMDGTFRVTGLRKAEKNVRPQPPFVTSTLLQEANRRLNFQAVRTMQIAQELYEGLNVGDRSAHGLITYMRTDSLRVSDEARAAAKEIIVGRFGESFYPAKPNEFRQKKKNVQDAHEAIRPSDPSLTPADVAGKLTPDQYKLYKLIWERFLASQMAPAVLETVTAEIRSGDAVFHANGTAVKFRGYRALCDEPEDEENENGEREEILPPLREGEELKEKSLTPAQKFTQPPQRYTEGSLIKVLEEMGIGRPSTLPPTIATILAREYVRRDGKTLVPTELGVLTNRLMRDAFPHIVDYNFTAEMEEDLDAIEEGTKAPEDVLNEFYSDFEKQLESAEKTVDKEKYAPPKKELDLICEKCGARMIERTGKFGRFAACPNYPACRNTKKLAPEPGEQTKTEEPPVRAQKPEKAPEKQEETVGPDPCPNCGGEMVLRKGPFGPFYACRNYPACRGTRPYARDTGLSCPLCGKKLMLRQTKTKKTYYGCEGYPDCRFSSWDPPAGKSCPNCGAPLLTRKGKGYDYCSAKCGWKDGAGS